MRHLKVIILCLFLIAAHRMIAQNPPPPCGTPGDPSTYIDTLNGVIAYSNDHGGPVGCYDPNAFKWECVEFVERYYSQRFSISLGSIPTAAQAFGILQKNSQFLAFPEGSTALPKAEDILVFGINVNTPFGHVAIAKTDPIIQSDGSYQIPIIEQNSYLTHVLVMQGNAITGFRITGRLGLQNTAPIIGWVRSASSNLSNPAPSISQLQPNPLLVGSAAQRLTINGTGFLPSSTVTFDSSPHSATFVSTTQLRISLSSSDLATAGSFPVGVTNPSPGGGSSNTASFTVDNPVPSISGLSPSSLPVGSPGQTLTINGTGFMTISAVTFNGAAYYTTFVNTNQLSIYLSTTDLATAGTFPIVVTNPAPGGGSSSPASFPVTNGQTSHEWTWMSGSNTAGAIGVYGALGVASPSSVPGARDGGVSWTDSSGNFWLFGGEQLSGGTPDFNDLWEFSPTTNEWTWISGSDTTDASGIYGTQGVPSSANVPPARGTGAVAWIDHSNNLWLFGGYGDYGDMNDLWEFNPSTKEWAWMSGSNTAGAIGSYGTLGVASPSNVPGARSPGVSWIDRSGNLWLFGGYSYKSGSLNDLWEFSPTTKEWTWVGGSNTAGAPGVYGTQGVASAANTPGAGYGVRSWTDSSGNLWLFGGYRVDVNGSPGYLSDLWEFNPTAKTWTWVSGSNTVNTVGFYGTLGVSSPSNFPGARANSVSWIDSSNNLWLFGGEGFDSTATFGNLNDLWEFNPAARTWTWVSGANTANAVGVYGTQGIPAAGNIPVGRVSAVGWIDHSGNLWFFGGQIYSSSFSGIYELNDLWRYQP